MPRPPTWAVAETSRGPLPSPCRSGRPGGGRRRGRSVRSSRRASLSCGDFGSRDFPGEPKLVVAGCAGPCGAGGVERGRRGRGDVLDGNPAVHGKQPRCVVGAAEFEHAQVGHHAVHVLVRQGNPPAFGRPPTPRRRGRRTPAGCGAVSSRSCGGARCCRSRRVRREAALRASRAGRWRRCSGGPFSVTTKETGRVTGRAFEVDGGHVSLAGGWRHGPACDKGARWEPAELGPVVASLPASATSSEPVSGA